MSTFSLAKSFGFGAKDSAEGLPDIFALSLPQADFVKNDLIAIYTKILTDVAERTHGLKKEAQPLLWDNCLKSEVNEGLITQLAKAMSQKADLFIVYDKPLKVLRRADSKEQAQITEDYNRAGESKVGVYISFKKYIRTDMVALYSMFEYLSIASLNKNMNLSKSVQFKISDIRSSTGLNDSAAIRTQAIEVWKNLGLGKDVFIDAKDIIETAKPDMNAMKEGLAFLNQRRAFYLGLPEAYITGIQTGGLGSTGEQDTNAIERGLKSYFTSIMKPVLEAVFGGTVKYKSQSYRQIGQALEALKTFDLVGQSYLSDEMKKVIIEGLLDISPDDNDTEFEEDVEVPPVDPNAASVPPGAKPPAPKAVPNEATA